MANLIPEKIQREMRGHSQARFILSTTILALAVAATTSLLLLPSYVMLSVHGPMRAGSVPTLSAGDRAADQTAISHANAAITLLSPLINASSTSMGTIQQVVSLRPVGVHIDGITYIKGDPSSLMIVGAADSPSLVSVYRAALATTNSFDSVTVPVGALVGTDGGRFSITISGTF
jgi:hypothetical protein